MIKPWITRVEVEFVKRLLFKKNTVALLIKSSMIFKLITSEIAKKERWGYKSKWGEIWSIGLDYLSTSLHSCWDTACFLLVLIVKSKGNCMKIQKSLLRNNLLSLRRQIKSLSIESFKRTSWFPWVVPRIVQRLKTDQVVFSLQAVSPDPHSF